MGICDFNRQLAAKQEPLGNEFERVLFDNIWELYVRDPKPFPVNAEDHQ